MSPSRLCQLCHPLDPVTPLSLSPLCTLSFTPTPHLCLGLGHPSRPFCVQTLSPPDPVSALSCCPLPALITNPFGPSRSCGMSSGGARGLSQPLHSKGPQDLWPGQGTDWTLRTQQEPVTPNSPVRVYKPKFCFEPLRGTALSCYFAVSLSYQD